MFFLITKLTVSNCITILSTLPVRAGTKAPGCTHRWHWRYRTQQPFTYRWGSPVAQDSSQRYDINKLWFSVLEKHCRVKIPDMETESKKCPALSPQKQVVKNRSMSTGEIQQAKKAFHTPQTSLPVKSDLEKPKETPEGSDRPSSSWEELK
ncbi:hypothetical protein SKAU_G00265230 [Synaphobranchus kaupii]|uniref:Uncharacterized protein n=1 Tax=Synaphobranchus kaupii TaxID=118154 RepID=A0A9Q1EZ34_SYNKA|nr:hypothetical protein SKAU_G00265230 [Synaphobranchus kaupii]